MYIWKYKVYDSISWFVTWNLKFLYEYYFKDIGYYSCKINIIKRLLILGVQLNSNICTQVNYDV